MKKILKWLLIIIVLILTGAFIFIKTYDFNKYRSTIEQQLSTALNRPVSVGDIDVKISFSPALAVKNIKIDNPAGFASDKPFVSLDEADVVLKLFPLIHQSIQIESINFGDVYVSLIEQNGLNNWTFGDDKKSAQTTSKSAPTDASDILSKFGIDVFNLKKLVVSYQKDKDVQEVVISNFVMRYLRAFKMEVAYQDYKAHININMTNILDAAQLKGLFVANTVVNIFDSTTTLALKIDDLAKMNAFAMSMDVKTPNLAKTLKQAGVADDSLLTSPFAFTAYANGTDEYIQITKMTLDVAKAIVGNFKGSASDVKTNPNVNLSGDIKVANEQISAKYGIKPFTLDFDVNMVDKVLKIVKADLIANRSDLSMKASVSLKKAIPDVYFEALSNYFDVADLIIPVKNASSAKTASKPATTDDKIDLSALKSVNLQSSVQFKNLTSSDDIDYYVAFASNMQIKDGLFVANPMLRIFDGLISGTVGVNGKTSTPVMTAKMTGKNVNLNKIPEIAKELTGSKLNFAMNVNAIGNTPKALTQNLNGSVQLNVTEGKIINKVVNSTLTDTLGLVMTKSYYGQEDKGLTLYCLASNLKIVNGKIMFDDNFVVETSLINLLASGNVDLAKEELSVSMQPKLHNANVKTNQALLLSQVLKIAGPFDDIGISIDAGKAVSGALNAGVDAFTKHVLKQDNSSALPTIANGAVCENVLAGTPIGNKKAPVVTQKPKPATDIIKQEVQKQVTTTKEKLKTKLLDSLDRFTLK